MLNDSIVHRQAVLAVALVAACLTSCSSHESFEKAIDDRDFPSVFMAWYNIDMPEYPVDTECGRIESCAKHDLMWEEPLSQKGEGVPPILGLEWDGKYQALAETYTEESLERARRNKKQLKALNPNIICLLEIRWRDAPKSFLPSDSPYWMRSPDGGIRTGWTGGWEPFYLLDYKNEGFLENLKKQAAKAVGSGIYDGIMLDWSGDVDVVKTVREAIGKDKLLIVNIHDDIEDGIKYKEYINGAFMELNPVDTLSLPVDGLRQVSAADANKRDWGKVQKALQFFETNLLEPRVNCLEVWGNRKDYRRMRAVTTMGLTMSDAYVLYCDPNPLPTPDHQHDWYPFWDVRLGRPVGKGYRADDGSWHRSFDNGYVVFNPYGNDDVTVVFPSPFKRISDGSVATSFTVPQRDGDIFIPESQL